jgi:hypothetical protein
MTYWANARRYILLGAYRAAPASKGHPYVVNFSRAQLTSLFGLLTRNQGLPILIGERSPG